MKKILFMLAITLSFLSAINVQKASKDELMCIKGIGEKKASAIMKYRKSHKLKSAQDLLEIKGFGKALVKNVEKDIKSVACGGKKSSKKSSSKKSDTKKKTSSKSEKKDAKKKDVKKKESKKDSKKKDSKE
jgi:competence protein ComEA